MRDPLAKARRPHKPAKPMIDRIMDAIEGETDFDAIIELSAVLVAVNFHRQGFRDLPVECAEIYNMHILDYLGLKRNPT